MMKFTAIVLLACVALALAGPVPEENEVDVEGVRKPSVFTMFPVDEAEISKLKAGNEDAAAFCTESRDFVKGALKQSVNSNIAGAFDRLFGIFASIAQAGLDQSKAATTSGASMIQSGEGPVIDEEGNHESPFIAAVKNVFLTSIQVLTNASKEQIEMLKTEITSSKGRQVITDTCKFITQTLRNSLDDQWTSYKKSHTAVVAARPDETGCITAGRIYRLDSVCGFWTIAQNMYFKGQ